jgi:hypothetical protein
VTSPAWAAALERYEQRLELLGGWLARCGDGDPAARRLDVAPFEPPAGLGPLPEALRPRALALLARTETVQRAAQAAADRSGRELAGLRRARAAAADPSPRLLDRKA